MPFTIRDIPAAMRLKGWTVGARLMDRWFAGRPRVMRQRNKTALAAWTDVETHLVTMAWASRFDRVVDAEDRLLATWAKSPRLDPTSRVIAQRLRDAGIGGDRAVHFILPVRLARSTYTGRSIARSWHRACSTRSTISIAQWGNALLMLAVAGEATPIGRGRWRVRIDEVGTQIRDSYDFLGSQPLGAWGPSGFSRIAVLAPEVPIVAEERHSDGRGRYFSVNNDSFRAYCDHYGRWRFRDLQRCEADAIADAGFDRNAAMRARHAGIGIRSGAMLMLILTIGGYVYALGGATRFGTKLSPQRDEAVDFYSATRWQNWTHPGGDLIGHVGLRRIADGTTLATSPAFDMSGENLVIWDRDRVQVGSTAIYDRVDRGWTLVE